MLLISFLFLSSIAAKEQKDQDILDKYRLELAKFRTEFGGNRTLPDVRFFQFGMGQRTKLLYRGGALIDILNPKIVHHKWEIESDLIIPPAYLVVLNLKNGSQIRLVEDENGIWIVTNSSRVPIDNSTQSIIKLPNFMGHRYPMVLQVLHHELLMQIGPQGPVPNLFVYPKPWYRDGAMIALVFERTGNLKLLNDWILDLNDPYDHNAGVSEPDNLGQALYLISTASDQQHPLVEKIMNEIPKYKVVGPSGPYINGTSDYSYHPVYQTKWLKFGLYMLGMADLYVVPPVHDSYSALFWMNYTDSYVKGTDSDDRDCYPYLGWACDHFHLTKKSPIGNQDYPLTWEQDASEADYAPLEIIDPIYVQQKLSAPHGWHAAEIFLYLFDDFKQF